MSLTTDELVENGARLLIWQLTETEEMLKRFLKNSDFGENDVLQEIKNPLRRRQKLVTKILLAFLGNERETEINYSPEGKPFLKNKKGTLSFSGCEKYIALLFHESAETGIDIEHEREKILRVADKFANRNELKWVRQNHEIEDLHLIWGAKESAFKLIGGGGIDFKNHLEVRPPVDLEKKAGKGKILFSKHLPIRELPFYYRYLEDYILVYTIV